MRLEGFIGPAYLLNSPNVDAQRLVNMYPEKIESGFGKGAQQFYFHPTPGLRKLLSVGSGPIRLVHVDFLNRIFVVSGNKLYLISESGGTWSSTLIGESGTAGGVAVTLGTSSGPVYAASMSFLGDGSDSSTMFVDGNANYLFLDSVSSNAFGLLTAYGYGDVATANKIVWSDGYFILPEGGTNKFFVSDLQSFNVDALNFASSEGSPDILLTLEILNRNLYLFNEQTIEYYSNTGNADFPFERVQGGFLEMGCRAKNSVVKLNNSIFFLGRSKDGTGVVYQIQGLQANRISTHAIENAISTYADISTARAYGYQQKGHFFYVLNFDEATWVFDETTGAWHERAYTNSGTLERHRADCAAFDPTHNYVIVGDYSNSNVYILDDTYFSDDGDAITRLRTCPHLSLDLDRVFYQSFQLDMEVGIGLDGGVQGSSPTVMLDFSNDGGHTWSSESWALADNIAGAIGEYKTRVKWNRLGSARDRIFRVKMTDPVKTVWIDAQIMVSKGNS
jgi:hypothetical protein